MADTIGTEGTAPPPPDHEPWVAEVALALAVLATIGSSVIIVAFVFYKQLRQLQLNRIVMALSVVNLVGDAAFLIRPLGPVLEDWVCPVQAAMIQFSGLASACMVTIIALQLLFAMCRRSDTFKRVAPWLSSVGVSLCAIDAILVAVVTPHAYGRGIGLYCWIRTELTTLQIASQSGWISLMTVFNLLTILVALCVMKSQRASIARALFYVFINASVLLLKVLQRAMYALDPTSVPDGLMQAATYLTPIAYGAANVLIFASQAVIPDGTLRVFLTVPGAVDVFMTFLRKEHSEENLEFWIAVKDYQRRASEVGPTQNDAASLVLKYLQVNAPSQVNLPASVRRDTIKKVASGATWQTFDECEHEIVRLMEQDGFRRFTADPSYRLFLETTEQAQIVPRGRLVIFDMVSRVYSMIAAACHRRRAVRSLETRSESRMIEFETLRPPDGASAA